jgi:thiamine pyridinylase
MSTSAPHTARKGELFRGPSPAVPPSPPNELNVALYPYVPSPQAFVAAIQQAWSQLQPQVTLNFVPYDPYSGPPDPNLDVFAFDCIFADDLFAANQIEWIGFSEFDDPEDLLGFAFDAVQLDSNNAAGIPYLGCTNVLYYRAGDPDLDNDNPLGISDLMKILGQASYPGPAPPENSGLIIDMGGKTTDACIYASLWRQQFQTWWPKPFPTGLPPDLDPSLMDMLRAYALMAGQAGALYPDESGHDRTGWFANGLGRAFVGLTETMSGWTPDFLSTIGFRPFPTAAEGDAANILCYADAVGIRPGLADKRDLAVQLANVVASAGVIIAALYPSSSPQYLMPARQSVLSQLAAKLPEYAAISEMLSSRSLSPFRLGPGVSDWTHPAGAAIIAELFPGAEEQIAAAQAPRHPHHHTTPAGMWRRGG